VRAKVQVIPSASLFKIYLLNNAEAFFDQCLVQEHQARLEGALTTTWDLIGKDAVSWRCLFVSEATSTFTRSELPRRRSRSGKAC